MGDLKVVRHLLGSMRAQEQSVGAKVLAGHRFHIRQPLRCEGGPFKRAAVHNVVKEDAVLLPYLVFLVDHLVPRLLVGLGHVHWENTDQLVA